MSREPHDTVLSVSQADVDALLAPLGTGDELDYSADSGAPFFAGEDTAPQFTCARSRVLALARQFTSGGKSMAESGIEAALVDVPSDFVTEGRSTGGPSSEAPSASGSGVVRLPGSSEARDTPRRPESPSQSTRRPVLLRPNSRSQVDSESSAGHVLGRARVATRVVRRSELTPNSQSAVQSGASRFDYDDRSTPPPDDDMFGTGDTTLAGVRPMVAESLDSDDLIDELSEDRPLEANMERSAELSEDSRPTGASVLMAWANKRND